ncbi:hypothetical protein V8C43DRAFT_298794 [Trichoderma afarasin]
MSMALKCESFFISVCPIVFCMAIGRCYASNWCCWLLMCATLFDWILTWAGHCCVGTNMHCKWN